MLIAILGDAKANARIQRAVHYDALSHEDTRRKEQRCILGLAQVGVRQDHVLGRLPNPFPSLSLSLSLSLSVFLSSLHCVLLVGIVCVCVMCMCKCMRLCIYIYIYI